MIEFDLVQQRGGRYSMGVRAVSLGSAYLNTLDLRTEAHDVLVRLAEESGETVHLMVYSEGQVVYLDKIAGRSPIQMASRIGDRAPVHCTASGKAMLAHLPEAELDRLLAAGLAARTENTITEPERLRAELDRIRESGYAVDDIENEYDIRCVSAPVFDSMGHVAAAISASGPAVRVGEKTQELAALMMSGATQLSERLGASSQLSPGLSSVSSGQTERNFV